MARNDGVILATKSYTASFQKPLRIGGQSGLEDVKLLAAHKVAARHWGAIHCLRD